MTGPLLTVGVLYSGEMGAALSAPLRRRGIPVVTTTRGRGAATARRAAESGAVMVGSLEDVVRAADVVVSLVVPSAAEAVARAYSNLAHLAPRGALFVDANSVGPEKALAMSRAVEAAGRSFVDAAINGLAKNLATSGTLFLSGPRAGEVAELFQGAVARVRVLGEEPGRASAMKMLLGGLSKGVCALFAELALLAERQGMLDEMVEATAATYPGVAALAERMLPTYARHAGRRHTEMTELEATARAAGMTPDVVEAVCRMHGALARAMPGGTDSGAAGTDANASTTDTDVINGNGRGGLAAIVRDLAARLENVK